MDDAACARMLLSGAAKVIPTELVAMKGLFRGQEENRLDWTSRTCICTRQCTSDYVAASALTSRRDPHYVPRSLDIDSYAISCLQTRPTRRWIPPPI